MALLVVQLSDLHGTALENSAEPKWESLCHSVGNYLDDGITGCAIVFCGDAAFGGKNDEFKFALGLLKRLKLYIQTKNADLPIHFLAVPGNHDCDLTSEDPQARETLRKLVMDKMPAPSTGRILLSAQKNYFHFAKELSPNLGLLTEEKPFYTSADINVDGKIVRFHLINSAWTSVLKETDDLRFPLDAFNPPTAPPAHYTITVMHHPIQWFLMPGVRRELRNLIESQSEVVLTGHEHEREASHRQVENGVELDYVEGGVLQEPKKPNICNFNLIRFDFAERKRQLFQLTWKTDHFEPEPEAEKTLESNPHRLDQKFALKPSFAKMLDELEDPLTHPKGGRTQTISFVQLP